MLAMPFMTPTEFVSACLLHLHVEYIKCHQAMQLHIKRPLHTPSLLTYSQKILNTDKRPRVDIEWLAATGGSCCCSPRDAAMSIACP